MVLGSLNLPKVLLQNLARSFSACFLDWDIVDFLWKLVQNRGNITIKQMTLQQRLLRTNPIKLFWTKIWRVWLWYLLFKKMKLRGLIAQDR